METSSAQWLSALGMEDPLLARQCSTALTGEELGAMMNITNKNFDSIGSIAACNPMDSPIFPPTFTSGFHLGVRSSDSLTGYERPLKMPKQNNFYSTSAQLPFSSLYPANPIQNFEVTQKHCLPQQLESYITSLPQLKDEIYEAVAPTTPTTQGEIIVPQGSDANNSMDAFNFYGGKEFVATGNMFMEKHLSDKSATTSKKNSNVPPKILGHTQDHIMAERKRRERLSQRFIALSAIVPGLKKMDKTSVLDNAIKYVKKLQERLNVLEQQAPKKTVHSVIYVNKSRASSDHGTVTSSENSSGVTRDDLVTSLPEIEARVADKNVLIHIHCEKKKGLLPKFLAELEKLQLAVVNATILSFSETTMDLTLNAQMEEGCNLTVTGIVKALEALFKKTT